MNRLFNEIMFRHKLQTDTQLAKLLFVSPAFICNVRAGRKNLSPRLILAIYDRAGLTIEEIRQYAKENG